jgi:hypothetical protein
MSAKHNVNAAHLQAHIATALQQAANNLMYQYQSNLKKTLSIAGTGKAYRGGNKGKGSFRRRSVPGAPPAVDTGALLRSVQTAPTLTSRPGKLQRLVKFLFRAVGIGSGSQPTKVVRYVILGVKGYGFMLDAAPSHRARPWIARSADPVRAVAHSVVTKYLQRAIRTYRPPSKK